MNDLLADQVADLAEKIWPLYRDSGWEWREEPVTLARLTAELMAQVDALLAGNGYSTGGLMVWRDGDDPNFATVTVDVGHLDLPKATR